MPGGKVTKMSGKHTVKGLKAAPGCSYQDHRHLGQSEESQALLPRNGGTLGDKEVSEVL